MKNVMKKLRYSAEKVKFFKKGLGCFTLKESGKQEKALCLFVKSELTFPFYFKVAFFFYNNDLSYI